MRDVEIGGKVCLGSGRPLAWIVGPGAGQDESRLAATAERLKKLSEKLDVPLVFKAGRGSESLEVPSREGRRELLFEKLAWIRSQFELPVLGEVESADDLEAAGQLLDVIQVPDFLCEQSLPLAAATATGRPVSVRRTRFVSPEAPSRTGAGLASELARELEREPERRESAGVMLPAAGVSFGYENVLADMTMIPRLRALGWPVVFDVVPLGRCLSGAGAGSCLLGPRELLTSLLRAAVAAGAAAVSLEIALGPAHAGQGWPSLEELEELMQELHGLGDWMRLRGYA